MKITALSIDRDIDRQGFFMLGLIIDNAYKYIKIID